MGRPRTSWDTFRTANKGSGKNHKQLASEYKLLLNPSQKNAITSSIIGKRIRVWWSSEQQYFTGTVSCKRNKLFLVNYDDNTNEWEHLDKETVEILPDDDKESVSAAETLLTYSAGPEMIPVNPEAPATDTETVIVAGSSTKFCLMHGNTCGMLPKWARFCSTCGHKQY